MLFVTNGNQTEAILESNYEKYEEQNGTAMQISFSSFSFAENAGHELIDFNTLIEDEDGHEYKIKQLTKNANSKTVVATHVFYELVGHRKYDSFTGTNNFNAFANWLFNGTGWTFINVDVNETLAFNVFGNDNFLQLVQRLITKFNCEMQILPGKVIRFAKVIGQDNDKQYRFKNNIKEISENIDTTNVRTRIVATGAEGLAVTYTSPLANNPLFGVLDAEPIKDESIASQSELLELAKLSLNDTPSTNIDASVLDTDGNVGDYVWIIHEEMGLEYQARILSKRTRRDYQESTVEIGNAKKRTIEDALIDQKEEIKANAEKAEADLEGLEEQTNEELARLDISDNEIRLSVQNAENTLRSEISITATQIRSEVVDTENRLNSTITQTASNIQLQVNDANNRIATVDIKADQIQSNVTNLANSTSSSITQLSNNINLKVDKGGVITDINLTPGTATINAEKINLNGAVMVNGNITGSSNINISNNISIGNAIYFGSSGLDYIDTSSGNMSFNSWGKFVFNGAIGVDVYGGLTVNGKRVLTTDDL